MQLTMRSLFEGLLALEGSLNLQRRALSTFAEDTRTLTWEDLGRLRNISFEIQKQEKAAVDIRMSLLTIIGEKPVERSEKTSTSIPG